MNKLNTVLLIEDDDTVNFYNDFLLKQLNVAENIIIRENGEEALEYLKACAQGNAVFPDLIFLDINMPVMNGFEFLEAYEGSPLSGPDAPLIVMLTTSLHPEDLKRADDYDSISEYIYKPLTHDKVNGIMDKYFVPA